MGPLSTLAGKALALLAVKPFNSQGPVRISSAPSSITDIPATVLDAVGVPHDLPGEPALKLAEGSSRVRPWAVYDWEHESWSQNYFDTMDIVEIGGNVLDGSRWTLNNTIYGPTANSDSRTRGLYEIHKSRSGPDYRWSMPNVFFHVPEGTRSFEMKVRSIAPQPQTVTVSAGDQSTRNGDADRSIMGHPQACSTGAQAARCALGARQRRTSVAAARHDTLAWRADAGRHSGPVNLLYFPRLDADF